MTKRISSAGKKIAYESLSNLFGKYYANSLHGNFKDLHMLYLNLQTTSMGDS